MDMIKKRAAMRGQSGFTLVELLVAVAILAILAGVAVFAVGNLTGQSASAACKTEGETIRTAIASARAATQDNSTPDPKDANTYLQGSLKYFDAADVPTAVGSAQVTVARDSGTLTDVGDAANECPNVTA
jgi:prepilin-type N-terminal cleavage/methylation domain-containing protein